MKKSMMILAVLGSLLLTGAAADLPQAGILDKLEEKLKQKAKEKKEKIEKKIEKKAEEKVEETVEGAIEGVITTAEAAVEGAVEGATGAAGSGWTGGAPAADSSSMAGHGEAGPFFVPPAGVSNLSDLAPYVEENRRSSRGSSDVVSLQRKLTRDAYYAFWGIWYRKLNEFETYLRGLRQQQSEFLKWDAAKEAQAVGRRIADLEARRREFLETPRWQQIEISSSGLGPLGFFGVKLGSEALPGDGVDGALGVRLQQLGLASQQPMSDDARRQFTALAKDITAIRDHVAAGELEAAQRIMDRRWDWVMSN